MRKKQAALIFIFATVLIDIIGIGLIIPVLPQLLMEVSGLNTSESSFIGGTLIATYAIMQFFFAPILGGLSDQFGRRPLLLMALFGLGLDYLIIVFAPNLIYPEDHAFLRAAKKKKIKTEGRIHIRKRAR